MAAAVASALLCTGCYWGFGAGPTVPLRQDHQNGANSMTEIGVVFDYRRVVRLGYARSLQLYDGALFTVSTSSRRYGTPCSSR